MLYKQAWQELKDWIKHQEIISCEIDAAVWEVVFTKINELERRWAIIPRKGASNDSKTS